MSCRKRNTISFVIGICSVLWATLAHAQNPMAVSFPETSPLQGTVTGDKNYLVQNPELILGSDVMSVLFAPDSRSIIMTRATRSATPASLLGKPEQAPGEVTINLWRSRTHRTGVVWRRSLEPGQTAQSWMRGWVGTTGVALGTVLIQSRETVNGHEKITNTYFTLLLDTSAGSVREVVIPPGSNGYADVSPTLPLAALVGADGSVDKQVRFIRSDGTISAPLAVPGHVYTQRWSEDGSVLQGLSYRDGAKPSDEPDWYAIDPIAMTVTSMAPPPKNKEDETDYSINRTDTVQERLPLNLVTRTSDKNKGKEVWLEARQNPKSAVRLTISGFPVGVLPDLSGAVYRTESGLYITPLLAVPKNTSLSVNSRGVNQPGN